MQYTEEEELWLDQQYKVMDEAFFSISIGEDLIRVKKNCLNWFWAMSVSTMTFLIVQPCVTCTVAQQIRFFSFGANNFGSNSESTF